MTRTATRLATGAGFALDQLTVRSVEESWSSPEAYEDYRLVLVRSGAFRARVGSHRLLADPAVAYLGVPAEDHSIAHRAGVEDVYTSVRLSERYLAELVAAPPVHRTVTVTGDAAVLHRLLVAAATRARDPFELAELATRLVGRLLATSGSAGAAPTKAAHRALAEGARELLALDPVTLGLRTVARTVGCSPHHLSRVFRRCTGITLTRYRNRVRAFRALDAVAAGHRDLAGLAAELGFADHAHLTRTVTRECGRPPRALRALLAS